MKPCAEQGSLLRKRAIELEGGAGQFARTVISTDVFLAASACLTARWALGRLLANPPWGRYHLRLMHDVTQLLTALGHGDPHAASRLLRLGYDELRKLAAQRMG